MHVVDVGWGWILKAPRGSTMDFLAMMAFVRSEQADATPLNDTALDSSLCCIPVPVPALLILTLWWRSIASAISRRRPWGGTGLRGHPPTARGPMIGHVRVPQMPRSIFRRSGRRGDAVSFAADL